MTVREPVPGGVHFILSQREIKLEITMTEVGCSTMVRCSMRKLLLLLLLLQMHLNLLVSSRGTIMAAAETMTTEDLLRVTTEDNSQNSCSNPVAGDDTDDNNNNDTASQQQLQCTRETTNNICMDHHKDCEMWADEGKCIVDTTYMETHCAKACGKCRDDNSKSSLHHDSVIINEDDVEKEEDDQEEDFCEDQDELCNFWAEQGECENNPNYMHSHCSKSCGTCRKSAPFTKQYGERQWYSSDEGKAHIEKMHEYMIHTVFVDEKYTKVREGCRNNDADCGFWAVNGECENKPAYMLTNCAPACLSCEMVDFNVRCPVDKDAPKFLQNPGDLHTFFLNLVVKAMEQNYTPKILSAPANFFREINSNATLAQIPMDENVLRDGPWIITLDNIFTEQECDHLIELGAVRGYERSLDVGELKIDGTFSDVLNPRRTSTNAWCVDECYEDEQVQVMHARIEELTGIPNNHSEYWQLLKYEESQEYMQHHDYIEEPFERAPGVRILTIFLYLNEVEAGGGTRFNNLNITVTPKRGQVLIWPSVLDESPDEKDPRTDHQALPVEKGIKYGANAWVHQRDFKTPLIFSCA